jgi:CBS domain-containing protein
MKRIRDLKSRSIGHHGIEDTASVADAAREFLATRVSALIVYDVDKMVGIFTKNDLVRACAKHPDGIATSKVGQCMKMGIYTTTLDANLDDVAAAMIEKGFRHVPVLEVDKVVGMVTHIDILLYQRELLTEENINLIRYIQGSY